MHRGHPRSILDTRLSYCDRLHAGMLGPLPSDY